MTTSTPDSTPAWRKLFNVSFDTLPAERQLELSESVVSGQLTFVQAVGHGVTDLDGVDDWVDYWHDVVAPAHPKLLREFLGLDAEKYARWMRESSVMETFVQMPGHVNKVFAADDLIPLSYWGRDHWSTLAYAETVMEACGGFQVGLDARMKSGRQHFRVMKEGCPQPKRAGSNTTGLAVVMEPEHSTKLNDGQCVRGHDDWSCIQDMAAEGLFTCGADGVEPGEVLSLSDKGAEVLNALRAFKRGGGQYANFRWPAQG